VCGPEQERDRALERLSVIADSYLSVSSPVQRALPVLLGSRFALRQQIRERVAENLRLLDGAIGRAPAVSRLMVAAGWDAVLGVPALVLVESLAIRRMHQQNVMVHPGSFYGFSGDGWLVVSLLTLPEIFREGIERIARHFA
jgi:aspartate/methionine/tyrosine aminotransferase